jgi:hypothetical protein
MLRREKRAQLVKNIIAESERVIEFGEHASIHTSRQSCSKAGKARIFGLVWGVIRGIPVHNGIDRIGWSGADRPLLAMGTGHKARDLRSLRHLRGLERLRTMPYLLRQ